MYTARVLLAVDDEHRPPLHSFAVAARAACGQTNGRTDEHGTGIYVVGRNKIFHGRNRKRTKYCNQSETCFGASQ